MKFLPDSKSSKAYAENQTQKTIKCLRTDRGGEYVSREMSDFLKAAGIGHQMSPARTPQWNVIAERTNRTIAEKGRWLMFHAGLGKCFWAEAFNTAVYLKNLSPTAALNNVIPEEAWSGSKVDVSHLRIFGCRAQKHIPKEDHRKLNKKSAP